MERMQSMFSNAFNTKAGQLVEKATAANLTSEDWGLNMEICDCVNGYDEGPKDAVKAIKRRLTNNKNQTQIIYTLTVLEACVKNCGSRFHILVTSKEFCNDVLLKIIQSKNTPALTLQNKILGMIQEWAETFKNTAAMRGVVEVYEELKEKEWEFPQKDQAAAAPIITPKRSVPQPQPAPVRPQMFMPGMMPVQPQQRVPAGARPSTGPITPSQEQITKLRSELQIVLGNVQVMSEMLTELEPTRTEASDLELLQELNRTCRAMQQRVVELVERVANEELTVELLKVNDDLNNVFLRYDRFEKYRSSQPAQTEAPPTTQQTMPGPGAAPYPTPGGAPYPTPGGVPYPTPGALYPPQHTEPPPSYSDTEQPTPEVNDLIDLGDLAGPAAAAPVAAPAPTYQPTVPSVTNDMAGLSLDQMMMTPSQPASYAALSQDLAQFGDSSMPEPTIAEMSRAETEVEQWLQEGDSTNVDQTQSIPTSVSNGNEEPTAATDEFNAFLSERAAAGEQLPSVTGVPAGAVGQTNGADSRQRKMQAGNQPMFGL